MDNIKEECKKLYRAYILETHRIRAQDVIRGTDTGIPSFEVWLDQYSNLETGDKKEVTQ